MNNTPQQYHHNLICHWSHLQQHCHQQHPQWGPTHTPTVIRNQRRHQHPQIHTWCQLSSRTLNYCGQLHPPPSVLMLWQQHHWQHHQQWYPHSREINLGDLPVSHLSSQGLFCQRYWIHLRLLLINLNLILHSHDNIDRNRVLSYVKILYFDWDVAILAMCFHHCCCWHSQNYHYLWKTLFCMFSTVTCSKDLICLALMDKAKTLFPLSLIFVLPSFT